MKLLFFLLIITGCSSNGTPREGQTPYSYADVSGSYRFIRETKQLQKKIVTRNQLLSTKGSQLRVLEKSILVSQKGSIKSGKARLMTVRPLASEFVVWLEGKRYSSKMQLNAKAKAMKLTLNSPESRWQGVKEIPFPKGKYFCFFNQIPECLYHNYLLNLSLQREHQKFDFYVIWDSFPFIQDQYNYVGKNLFATATVKYDGEFNKQYRYVVEVEGQMILYTLSKSFDLVKMAWIAQGITVAPPGEAIVDE
ncbi:MAG: hypothetical protein NDI69_16605 [Bacteriovoracaceae bacterium]|nr:hypothetical protein [Bacteriovoracaceae bacterium]